MINSAEEKENNIMITECKINTTTVGGRTLHMQTDLNQLEKE